GDVQNGEIGKTSCKKVFDESGSSATDIDNLGRPGSHFTDASKRTLQMPRVPTGLVGLLQLVHPLPVFVLVHRLQTVWLTPWCSAASSRPRVAREVDRPLQHHV